MPMPTIRRFTQTADVNPKADLPSVPIEWTVHPHIVVLPGVVTWVSPRVKDTTPGQAFVDMSDQRAWRRWSLNDYSRATLNGKPAFRLPHNAVNASLGVGLMSDGAALPNYAFLSSGYYVMLTLSVTAEHASSPAILFTAAASGPAAYVVGIQRMVGGKLRVRHGDAYKETVNPVLPVNTPAVVEVSWSPAGLSIWVNGVEAALSGGSALAAPAGTVTSQGINQAVGLGTPNASILLGELVVASTPVSAQSLGDRASRLASQGIYWDISVAVP